MDSINPASEGDGTVWIRANVKSAMVLRYARAKLARRKLGKRTRISYVVRTRLGLAKILSRLRKRTNGLTWVGQRYIRFSRFRVSSLKYNSTRICDFFAHSGVQNRAAAILYMRLFAAFNGLLSPLVVILIVIPACNYRDETQSLDARPAVAKRIVVSNAVVESHARKILRDSVEIVRVPPEGFLSKDWKPNSNDILAMQAAAYVIVQDSTADPWIQWTALPWSRMLELAPFLTSKTLLDSESPRHQHGPEGAPEWVSITNGAWQDPAILLAQATAIHAFFQMRQPDFIDLERWRQYRQELQRLDQRASEVTKKLAMRRVLVVGEQLKYFARRMGWGEVISAEAAADRIASSNPVERIELIVFGAGLNDELRLLTSIEKVPAVLVPAEPTEDVVKQLNQSLDRIEAVFAEGGESPKRRD
jgi:ABC-type Zn uptake system ZnuABC Zn-binding protein ZnuA